MMNNEPEYIGTLRSDRRVVRGTKLAKSQQEEALRAFVHRSTKEHKFGTGPFCFESDAEWLANTFFNVTKVGVITGGRCESHPTWPDNPELRRKGAL